VLEELGGEGMSFSPRRLPNFKHYLRSCGAVVLSTTNPYEVVRFKANGITSIIYQGKKGYTFTGESKDAWQKFIGGATFVVDTKKSRRKKLQVDVRTLLDRDGDSCFYCQFPLVDDITVEHLVPLLNGGSNQLSNMVLAHKQCNNKAGHLSVMEKIKLRESYDRAPASR
jgi:hypothetical protein